MIECCEADHFFFYRASEISTRRAMVDRSLGGVCARSLHDAQLQDEDPEEVEVY